MSHANHRDTSTHLRSSKISYHVCRRIRGVLSTGALTNTLAGFGFPRRPLLWTKQQIRRWKHWLPLHHVVFSIYIGAFRGSPRAIESFQLSLPPLVFSYSARTFSKALGSRLLKRALFVWGNGDFRSVRYPHGLPFPVLVALIPLLSVHCFQQKLHQNAKRWLYMCIPFLTWRIIIFAFSESSSTWKPLVQDRRWHSV